MGASLSLTWPATGQASYSVLRSSAASLWTGTAVLGTTSTTTWSVPVGPATPGIVFYNVD
jgi:hypothetical protein